MPRLVLWVEDAAAPAAAKILAAFQAVVLLSGAQGITEVGDRTVPTSVMLWDGRGRVDKLGDRRNSEPWPADWAEDWIVPLTLNVPPTVDFLGQEIHAVCRDVAGLRQQVAQWGYATGEGDLWLPIVLTAKGPLYGEVIGGEVIGKADRDFSQPIHLKDAVRQPLYALGQRLVRSLDALPGVYLVQFRAEGTEIEFDRVLPFPDERAIASIGVQTPDLFACHWRCITHQPINDLSIEDLGI
jgi:hypothetical protein